MAYPEPTLSDFVDEDGYTDYEAYDVHWSIWQQDQMYGAHTDIPDLRESWCIERQPEPVEEDNSLATLIAALME